MLVRPFIIAAHRGGYIIGQKMYDIGNVCGVWHQPFPRIENSRRVHTVGEPVVDIQACIDAYTREVGHNDHALYVPLISLRYEPQLDRLEFWLVSPDRADPEQWRAGPHFLHRFFGPPTDIQGSNH
jgi:hypothetical protein